MHRVRSPFADAPPVSAQPADREPDPKPDAEATGLPRRQWAPTQPAAPSPAVQRPRRDLLEVLEGWMPGAGAARLPSVATVRAYHKAGQYVPWEAWIVAWPARIHGWFAVAWLIACTGAAWVGAGGYRARFRTLWQVGIPGLLRAQLPPLNTLHGVPLVWVACWSAVAWLGLKFWRLPMALIYLAAAAAPFMF